MSSFKNILAINGSAGSNSANGKLLNYLQGLAGDQMRITVYNSLKSLPHFDPELSLHNPPQEIIDFRERIQTADGILICTPEYVFSIPSGLKNAIEWCIATTVFSGKACGLITASSNGTKAHEELQLIMHTAMANFTDESCLLISGIKGKTDENGNINHPATKAALKRFMQAFEQVLAGM